VTAADRPILAHDDLGAGPPVVLLHGFMLSRALWAHAAPDIAHRGWRAIVPDLRGFGDTPPVPSCSMADHADDCAALLEHLGIREPVVVVGLSMGGLLALEFFARHRARVRALGLIDCRVAGETPEGRVVRETTARAALEQGSRAAGEKMFSILFGPGVSESLRARWLAILERTPPQGAAAGARALADRADHTATLARIDVPTLVVCGEHDAITPVELMRSIASRIPGACFEIIPGAGHMTPVERPAEFNKILGGFLGSL